MSKFKIENNGKMKYRLQYLIIKSDNNNYNQHLIIGNI